MGIHQYKTPTTIIDTSIEGRQIICTLVNSKGIVPASGFNRKMKSLFPYPYRKYMSYVKSFNSEEQNSIVGKTMVYGSMYDKNIYVGLFLIECYPCHNRNIPLPRTVLDACLKDLLRQCRSKNIKTIIMPMDMISDRDTSELVFQSIVNNIFERQNTIEVKFV